MELHPSSIIGFMLSRVELIIYKLRVWMDNITGDIKI